MNYHYCKNHYIYNRFNSRVVNIGGIPLGGSNPIRLQSMTTTDTMNTADTIDQSIRIIKSGAEYVRITAPSKKEARNLKKIQDGLKSKGYNTPLIADIHFTPKAAEIAAEIVPKVRINPGNYADRKNFKVFEISDIEYELELERIYERFSPLVELCKSNGTVMRIGTNHGSLSDRIMNRYGDTPLGMVESALEFIRICEDHNFYDIVLSMKSSNPIIMVNAYRLLVSKMIENKMNYPLHLGVTEAGDGMPGRVKSSIGIGSLLEDGIGDTVRVSLTEEPEFELPVAKKISNRYKIINPSNKILNNSNFFINPFEYKKRETINVQNFGLNNVPRVVNDLSYAFIDLNLLKKIGYHYLSDDDKWLISDDACDYIITDGQEIPFNLPIQLKIICKYDKWKKINRNSNYFPILTASEYMNFHNDNIRLGKSKKSNFFLQQGVCEGNPDVDAIYRLTNKKINIRFKDGIKINTNKSLVTTNSQNTIWDTGWGVRIWGWALVRMDFTPRAQRWSDTVTDPVWRTTSLRWDTPCRSHI